MPVKANAFPQAGFETKGRESFLIMNPFIHRLQPASRHSGFRQDSHWVWCGSPIRAEAPQDDGRYHLFASRWPKSLPFAPHWLFNSEVVRASSDKPEGPYRFEEVVLPWRERSYFDGVVTHNPSIHLFDDTYYLFYFGVTYPGDIPRPDRPLRSACPEHERIYRRVWENKRIGLATSKSIQGPWERPEKPLLEPRPGHWDAMITTNPAPCIRADGRTLMIYKSRRSWKAPLQLGLAVAPHPADPYERVSEEPLFPFAAEDPFLWFEEGRYHVIMKDMTGDVCGERFGGIYGSSEDGFRWSFEGDCKAYSRRIAWDDGTTTFHGNFERPQLLIQDGKPTHLFAAVGDSSREWNWDDSFNLCIPLDSA